MRFRIAFAVLVALAGFAEIAYAQKSQQSVTLPNSGILKHFTITIPPDQAPAANTVNPACPGSATAAHCAILTWTAPTVHTDNTPITGVLTYDVLRTIVSNGVPGAFAAVLSGVSGTTAEDDGVVGGTTYEYELVAHEAGNGSPSAASAASVALVIPVAPPNPTSAPTVVAH